MTLMNYFDETHNGALLSFEVPPAKVLDNFELGILVNEKIADKF